MSTKLRGHVAIVGQGESDEHGRLPHKSAFQLHAESARNALADAGLTVKDVDAVFSAGLWMGSETAEYLGIRPRYVDGTQIGGCSFIAHVQHAAAELRAHDAAPPDGRKSGSAIVSETSRNTTSTGMPIRTASGSTSTSVVIMRGPSASATIAST